MSGFCKSGHKYFANQYMNSSDRLHQVTQSSLVTILSWWDPLDPNVDFTFELSSSETIKDSVVD